MCAQVRIHDNKDQLVASSRCVPHCHFEISLSRPKQNIYETERRLCSCDSSFGCQSVKQPPAALRTIIFKLVWGSHVRTHTSRLNELTKLTFQASSIVLGVTTDLIPNQWTIQKNRLYQKGDGLQNTTWFAGCSQLGGPCPLSSSLHH